MANVGVVHLPVESAFELIEYQQADVARFLVRVPFAVNRDDRLRHSRVPGRVLIRREHGRLNHDQRADIVDICSSRPDAAADQVVQSRQVLQPGVECRFRCIVCHRLHSRRGFLNLFLQSASHLRREPRGNLCFVGF